MSDEAQSVIEAELREDEHLLWCGQPPKGLKGRAVKRFLIRRILLMSGLLIALALLFLFVTGNLWVFAPILVLLFLLASCGALVYHRRVAKVRAKTYYGVTDRRIIIVSDGPRRLVTSLNLRTLSHIWLAEAPGGLGMILFGPLHRRAPLFGDASLVSHHQPPRFDLIEDVRDVYNQIIDAQRGAEVNMTPR